MNRFLRTRRSVRLAPLVALAAFATTLPGPTAQADIVIDLDDVAWLGGEFTMYFAPGGFEGTLEAISLVDVVCDAGPQGGALTAYLSAGPFDVDALAGLPFEPPHGGPLQVGGQAWPLASVDLEAVEWGSWGSPQSPHFVLNDTYALSDGGLDVDGLGFMLGNGIAPPPSGGIERIWTGSVVLHGVNHVPSAGALALIGLAGLLARGVGRRRA